ncbi:MAG TPA: cell wall-binding repeat-containing protein [Nitriliruptorales bacterium]|nr:cell wall-binding repeat-containing protein [Nitriliruptorales bacterium]
MWTIRRLAAVAVTALLTAGLPVIPAAGRPPTADVRRITVAHWRPAPGGLQAAGWLESAPLTAGDIVMVGADWGGDPDVEVQVRGRVQGGWGGWRPLRLPSDEHHPDPGTGEAARERPGPSEPVWLGRLDDLQLRLRGAGPRDVTLHAVELAGGDGVHYLPPELRSVPAAQAAPAQPQVVPRSSWDPRNQCRPQEPPSYAPDVRFAYVHHTASTNSYGRSEGPAQVLSFCLYHVNTRGWDDLGYNALVDRYGYVYEGRAGGLSEPVIGAHAAGFNGGSFGVAMIGNFESSPPTAEGTQALRGLLAWKLDHHHVDPHGTTTEISGGGGTNKIAKDDVVTLPTILGHRDTGTTACPGGYLYQYVTGSLRQDVAAAGAPKLYGGPQAPRRAEEQPVIGERPHWDVRATRAGEWQLEIRDRGGQMVRSSNGAGDSIDLRWDLRDRRGQEVAPGTYQATLRMLGQDATPLATAFHVTPAAERRSGDERIATAVALSRWAFDEPRRTERGFPVTETVVIASSEVYADALVASPLAGSFGSPVLLTGGATLHPDAAEEIDRLGATEALIVGGEARLTEQIEQDLQQRTTIETTRRFAGPTRYDTAARVAWEIVRREGPDEALLALGDHPDPSRGFPDALSAGAFGATFDLPVLLVQRDQLPEPTRWALANRPSGGGSASGPWADRLTVFGGTAAVSPDVEMAASHAADGAPTGRFAGATRYDTSRLAAQDQLRRWGEAPQDPQSYSKGLETVLATGQNWPDALGAGAAADQRGAVFLLVAPTTLVDSAPARDWLQEHAAALVHAVAAGGTKAVSDGVLREVEAILRSDGPNRDPPETWGLADGPFALPSAPRGRAGGA